MRPFKSRWWLLFLCLMQACSWPVHGQDAGSKAGQMWKDAKAAFSAGNYAQAAGLFDALIKASPASTHWLDTPNVPPAPPKQQWLEPAFFMLGASYFNAKDWPNAIAVFGKYLQLFPQSIRTTQVRFSLAQANFLGDHLDDAITLFTSLLPNSQYHAKVLLLLVEADDRAGKVADAISVLEKERTVPDLNPGFRAKIDMKLLALRLQTNDTIHSLPLLKEINAEISHVPDIPAFNSMAIRLGDMFLTENKVDDALGCYRRVRTNEQIIQLQTEQIEGLEHQRAANLVRIQADPLNSDYLQLENKDIDSLVVKVQDILAKYRTEPPVVPPLYLRIGRAYGLDGKLWESAVVFRELLRRYPNCAQAESALYGSIVIFDKLKQTDRDEALCESYLTQYPQGKYVKSARYIRGALAYDAEDFDKAASYFQDALHNQPDDAQRQQIELILGDIKLRELKYDEAAAAYAQYQADYPQGAHVEEAQYRTALALLFGGKSDDAAKAIASYLDKYPQGQYVPDAEYRLATIQFADKQYDAAIAACKAWQKKFEKAGPLAEVLSLEGDCYALKDDDDDAVKSYVDSYQVAQTTEDLNYSLFAAAKLLQQQGKWSDIAAMFQEFIRNNPDHPTVVAALSWIGRADVKLGKVEEAKQFLADTAKQYLDDPSRAAVDEIITQLAQLYARRHLVIGVPAAPAAGAAGPAMAMGAPANSASATASAAAPGSINPAAAANSTLPSPGASQDAPQDPAKELVGILTIPDLDSKPTARARLLFAQAELARMQRKPEVENDDLLAIAKAFKPEDLSPILLGQVGDCLCQKGQSAQADPFYHELIDDYGDSEVADYGYDGLGQIALKAGDDATAERYFSKALEKGLAATKLKDITLGEAQALLALHRPNEAKPYFEQVASTRAWRGEATALSVFSLGEIQMQLGKPAEANAYYQRVYVAYQKYPATQAKAYLKSGEALEKLGKLTDARNTYAEMLKNPTLASYPEATQARQNLEQLTQQ